MRKMKFIAIIIVISLFLVASCLLVSSFAVELSYDTMKFRNEKFEKVWVNQIEAEKYDVKYTFGELIGFDVVGGVGEKKEIFFVFDDGKEIVVSVIETDRLGIVSPGETYIFTRK